MSQPHPPIPEPQPHPAAEPPLPTEDDEPRTQSILLPPSQRQTEQPAEPDRQPAAPTQQTPAEAAPPAGSTGGWGSPSEPTAPAAPLPDQRPLPPPGTAQLPAQPGAAPQADRPEAGPPYDPAPPSQVTGPVDFVPGFGDRPPGSAHGSSAVHPTPAPQAPHGSATAPGTPGAHPGAHPGVPAGGTSDGGRRSPLAALHEVRRTGPALPALVLGVLALVLLELGLSLDYGTRSLWDVVPTWSVFGTAAALLVPLAAAAGLTGKLPARTAWRVAAGGVGALALFWVLVALPLAASDRGFWLTAALAVSGAALWLAPGRTK